MSQPTPLEIADCLPRDTCWMLLYSGIKSQNSGNVSFLASDPITRICARNGDDLATMPPGHWFGYIGYESLHDAHAMPSIPPSILDLPAVDLFSAAKVSQWNHADDTVHLEHSAPMPHTHSAPIPEVAELTSSMGKTDYMKAVEDTIEQIRTGNFYQANITRKFYGKWHQKPDNFSLFKRLCTISPSPYSAYYQLNADTAILSSSPEGFLEVHADGRITTRPIKGSAPAYSDYLRSSAKDRAENLMIVDLMRNDLSRVCEHGSVRTPALFDIHDFETIQQMISTVEGKKRSECSVADVIDACFPPGSMTGAPKRAAMHWCAKQEQIARGVYSGAIGWIDTRNQSADLSVVIRTLIIRGNQFEFQVGGGIVADSDPQREWEETLIKARGICRMLDIEESALQRI